MIPVVTVTTTLTCRRLLTPFIMGIRARGVPRTSVGKAPTMSSPIRFMTAWAPSLKPRFTKNPAMLLPTSETKIALLDAQDQADGHRGGAERRADDDARLGRAVRGLHDPLGELPQGLARARGGGLERRERSRQEFQQRNP